MSIENAASDECSCEAAVEAGLLDRDGAGGDRQLLRQVAESLLGIWPKHHDSARMATPLLRTMAALLKPDNLAWLEAHEPGLLGEPLQCAFLPCHANPIMKAPTASCLICPTRQASSSNTTSTLWA